MHTIFLLPVLILRLPHLRHWPALLFCLLALFSVGEACAQNKTLFPLYSCIQPNVLFWESIYSRYTTRQGVFHDAENVGRVYSVIDLTDAKFPWASWINRERIKEEKQRISTLLGALASKNPPQTKEARRIAALFPHKTPKAFLHAQETIRMQLGQKDRFLQGVHRSKRYLKSFTQIFARYGLPPELAYLPHVESSFMLSAYSKAGASGLWQFTQATGQRYLMINDQVDERLDPLRAAEAAAQFLQDNYNVLGSWPLALTAYNYGRAGMLRAVRKHGDYPQIFSDYDQGYFKFAARNFYPEFLAAVRVAKRYEKSVNFAPASRFPEPGFRLSVATGIQQLLFYTGLSKEEFSHLNPALRPPVITGQRPVPVGYTVRLPTTAGHKQARIAPNRKRPVPHIKLAPRPQAAHHFPQSSIAH